MFSNTLYHMVQKLDTCLQYHVFVVRFIFMFEFHIYILMLIFMLMFAYVFGKTVYPNQKGCSEL